GSGFFLCPNDPHFTVRFAVEMLTVIWTPSFCGLTAERPNAYLHAVQIDSENVAADTATFIDTVFGDGKFMAAELALQAAETRGPISLDPFFNELRSSSACTGNDLTSRAVSAFKELETEIKPPQGIIFRVVHPPIEAPHFLNVSLPYGEDTCKSGFV